MRLNPTQIKNLKPKEGQKISKFYDGNGLFLVVTDSGNRWWRAKYRFGGKEKSLSLGVFPAISLKDARQKIQELKDQVKSGIDPSQNRKAIKEAIHQAETNSFEVVAREWFAVKFPGLADSHTVKVRRLFERDIFPWIGGKSISEITPPELLQIARRIEGRGAVETAHRAINNCSQVFRYGVATGRVISDPTRDLRGALKPVISSHFSAITEPEKIGELLKAIDGYKGTFTVCCAMKLAPLVFVRPGELRAAEWKDLDLNRAEWRYFVTKTKTEHIVPLSRQALEILRDIKPFSGHGRFVFPSARSDSRPMSDNAILVALRTIGFDKDIMTGHGFRAMARTLLDEVLKFPVHLIEHQLAHSVRDPLGRAYNRTTHLEERREMMQAWADYLDRLKNDDR